MSGFLYFEDVSFVLHHELFAMADTAGVKMSFEEKSAWIMGVEAVAS
jgi:hypothetical protein